MSIFFFSLLFWAQCGGSPKIERASLDGTERMVLVTASINQPVAITLGRFRNDLRVHKPKYRLQIWF